LIRRVGASSRAGHAACGRREHYVDLAVNTIDHDRHMRDDEPRIVESQQERLAHALLGNGQQREVEVRRKESRHSPSAAHGRASLGQVDINSGAATPQPS